MEMKNRLNHRPIPVTLNDLKGQNWCPCCKAGTITRIGNNPMVVCSECKQRYQIKDKEEKNVEAKTEAKSV